MKKIKSLKESPCSNCGFVVQCNERIENSSQLQEIQDMVFPDAEYNYHDCPIWIALNAPEMFEVDE